MFKCYNFENKRAKEKLVIKHGSPTKDDPKSKLHFIIDYIYMKKLYIYMYSFHIVLILESTSSI
jgi:hypothetical protein